MVDMTVRRQNAKDNETSGGIAGGLHLSFAGWTLFRRFPAIWPEPATQGGHACGKVRPMIT
ncbi:MAG: hypothetical protein J0H75_08850, partial [Rhizobiales bacterium]|nr:hypothetical protein [Hyphomicrobiales bacterium]